jgi:hypothetical protein
MKKAVLSIGGAVIAMALLAATVAAAGPHGQTAQERALDRETIPAILGLTQAQVRELRQDGLSLAQIAEGQNVDPQKLVEALMTQWQVRIEARVANGGLTAEEATQLKSQLETKARDMVYKMTLGGMQGAAVGAGPNGAEAGNGPRDGTGQGWRGGNGTRGGGGGGTCDGSGPNGAGRS